MILLISVPAQVRKPISTGRPQVAAEVNALPEVLQLPIFCNVLVLVVEEVDVGCEETGN